jgi:preprotein translocase subunit Sec61beta
MKMIIALNPNILTGVLAFIIVLLVLAHFFGE